MSRNPTQSALDFLRNCTTGVELLVGFTNVQYWVYTAEVQDGLRPGGGNKSLEDVLLEVEVVLRDRKNLVYYEALRPALWMFAGGPAPFAGQPDISSINIGRWGHNFKQLFSGAFRPTELSQYFRLGTHIQMPWQPGSQPPTPGSAMNDLMARMNPIAMANARATQQNAAASSNNSNSPTVSPQHNDVRSIYVLFTKSITACYAYVLAKNYGTFQLDSRTFVCSRSLAALPRSPRETLTVFTLNHHLANGTGLLVSIHVERDSFLLPFEGQDEVIIAPGGLSVNVLAPDGTYGSRETNQWKDSVRSQLRARGIDLAILNPDDKWLLVKPTRYPLQAAHTTDGDATGDGTAFYWPRFLCFSPDADAPLSGREDDKSQTSLLLPPIDAGSTDPILWFMSVDENGFVSPLRFAEEWFQGKAGREKIIEDRKRKKWEAEMAKKQAENASLSVASPLYIREGLQSNAGVYPTPPDGLVSHMNNVPTLQDGRTTNLPIDANASRTSIDLQHSEMMDLDMGGYDEMARQRPSIISRGSVQMERIGDDLFGDLEDDELGGQDITDADFSFFDEPELPTSVEERRLSNADAETLMKVELSSDIAADPVAHVDVQQSPTSGGVEEIDREAKTSASLTILEKIEDTPMAERVDEAMAVPFPLSPTSVRKKLFDFVIDGPYQGRRPSQFEPVPFNTALFDTDAKYGKKGAFAFTFNMPPPLEKLPKRFATSPQIKPLPPEGKRLKLGTQSKLPPTKAVAVASTVLDDSETSEDSESDNDTEGWDHETASLVPSPGKDRFVDDDAAESLHDIDTMAGLEVEVDANRQKQLLTSILQIPELRSVGYQKPARRQPSLRSTPPSTHLLPRFVDSDGPLNPLHRDFINLAQIIAEQLSFGFVNTLVGSLHTGKLFNYDLPTEEFSYALFQSVKKAVHGSVDTFEDCDLLRYLCVPEVIPDRPNNAKGPPQPQKRAMIPGLQTADGTPVPATALVSLVPPHVRVRRNDTLWDVLPPALPFWEHLGLGPAAGRKNIVAFCIYPGNDDLRNEVGVFLDYLSATFESCKLGAHVRATHFGNFSDGFVPVQLPDQATVPAAIQAVRDVCVELGRALADIDFSGKIDFTPAIEDINKIDTFVVYMVNPFRDDDRGLMELCSAFWTLYETYKQTVRSPLVQRTRPDVVLQIIPIQFIASPHAPVVMDSIFFQKLAREVYDRCPPVILSSDPGRLPIESAASIQLEQPLPKKIDFKLQSEPPADLMHENSHLHLGYAISHNREWLSVAWTDNTGKYQASSNFCLVGGRTFAEVARAIWGCTVEIMKGRRVAWRLCVCKAGELEREELDAWTMLAGSTSSVMVVTIITSFDPNPPVTIFPDPRASSNSNTTNKPAPHHTPVGTPQPGVSPDTILTPAATPIPDPGPDLSNDLDAHLVDTGDETWGLILGHRTTVSNFASEYRPTLSSGYILKSNAAAPSPFDDDTTSGLILVGVKLIWIGGTPKGSNQNPNPSEGMINSISPNSIPKFTADTILKDYLGTYRNLGVLARARGLRGTKRGAVPWHVAVALRAVEGLEAGFGDLERREG